MAERYILRVFLHAEQDIWNTFVSEHVHGHVLQSWNWGELKAGTRWKPLRLALWDTSTQKIVAAAQILQRTLPHIPAHLGHLAYIPRGPVMDWDFTPLEPNTPDPTKSFLAGVRTYLGRHGALALQIEPHLTTQTVSAQVALTHLKALGFHKASPIQPIRTITLDTRPDEAVLLANLKEKWRYNTRLAARKGVIIHAASSSSEVDAWYDLLCTTSERDQFGIHTRDYYRRAWSLFAPDQQARLFLAYADDRLLAGIFVSLVAGEAIYLYGASGNIQRNLMPNYLLQWEAIRWAKAAGAHSYDFWGIPPTDEHDEAMAGVYRFKSGWGGNVTEFIGNYEYVYHPSLFSFRRRLR